MTNQNGISNFIGGIIIGVVFFAGGLALFFYWGQPMLAKATASEKWPVVQGIVKSSDVATSKDNDGQSMYSPNVVFEYTVAGSKYISTSVDVGLGWSSSSSASAYRVVNKYPAGDSVEVAYDPADPSYGVLETGAHFTNHLMYWLGPALALMGLMIGVVPLLKFGFAMFAVGSSLASSTQSAIPAANQPGSPIAEHEDSLSSGIPSSVTNSQATNNFDDGITIQ